MSLCNGGSIVAESAGDMWTRFMKPLNLAIAHHIRFRRSGYRDRVEVFPNDAARLKHSALYALLSSRIHNARSALIVSLLCDEEPRTWVFSDPLRCTDCLCTTEHRRHDRAIYSTMMSAAALRQSEIVQYVATVTRAFRQHGSRYALAARAGNDKLSAAALLYDLINNCGNARDMCSVLWAVFRRREGAADALQSELTSVPIGDDDLPDGNLDGERGAPLERALYIAARHYIIEIEHVVAMLGIALMERRGSITTGQDAYFARGCSSVVWLEPNNAVSTELYGQILRGRLQRAFLRDSDYTYTMRYVFHRVNRLRAGCAMNETELRDVLTRCRPFVPSASGAFTRGCAFDIPGLGVDALHGATPNDTITPSPEILADSMHAAMRLPDFASLSMRRDVWRVLAPRAFGRIIRVFWALAVPFHRKSYGCYENISLCTAVRCAQSSHITEYRARLYESELRELRRRLRSDDADFVRYGPPSTDSAVPSTSIVDPAKLVRLEKRIRAANSNASAFTAPTYHATIRAIRDYGDWNSVMLLLVLFDRIIDDLDRFAERTDEENETRWRVWRAMLEDATTSQIRHALAPLHIFFHENELRELLRRSSKAAFSPAAVPATAVPNDGNRASGTADTEADASIGATMEAAAPVVDVAMETDDDCPAAASIGVGDDCPADASIDVGDESDASIDVGDEFYESDDCSIEEEATDEQPTRRFSDRWDGTEEADEAALLAYHFHADYVAAFEWAVVDTARGNPNIVPEETYVRSSACRRVRRDLRTCLERSCSQPPLGQSGHASDPEEIARSARLPTSIAPLLELSLRKCWRRHGVADRSILRLPLYRRYARAIVESTRDYYLFDAVMVQGGGPTCHDITYDVSQRLAANGSDGGDPSDLATAENVLLDYHRADNETYQESAYHVMRGQLCCWRPFYGDLMWYGQAPINT